MTPQGQFVSAMNSKCLQAAGVTEKSNAHITKCDKIDQKQQFTIRGGIERSSSPTTKTLGGCTCKDMWQMNGHEYIYPNNCATDTQLEKKAWCFTEASGNCVGSTGSSEWDFCMPSSTVSSGSQNLPLPSKEDQSDSRAPGMRGGGSGMARHKQRVEQLKSQSIKVDADGTRHIAVKAASSSNNIPVKRDNVFPVDELVSCVYGHPSPSGKGCQCNDGFKLPFCDDCLDSFYGFPRCVPKMECSGKCHHHGSCDFSTGTCICHANRKGEHCTECAPGFSGQHCMPGEGAGGSSSMFLVLAFLFAGALAYVGRSRGMF